VQRVRVRVTAKEPMLLFASAGQLQGVYRCEPGEEFEVPDGTELLPGIERVDEAAETPRKATPSKDGGS
jgi:hypothetical protein